MRWPCVNGAVGLKNVFFRMKIDKRAGFKRAILKSPQKGAFPKTRMVSGKAWKKRQNNCFFPLNLRLLSRN
jgi:hypothetical protein